MYHLRARGQETGIYTGARSQWDEGHGVSPDVFSDNGSRM